jgi:pimeloyl-ACP methyl ester carboxylesterase
MRFFTLVLPCLVALACTDSDAQGTFANPSAGKGDAGGDGDPSSEVLPGAFSDAGATGDAAPSVPGGPGPKPSRQCAQNKDAMGFFTLKSPKSDYVVRLPVGYNVATPMPYPMLVALHGCGDTAASFATWGATTYDTLPKQDYIAVSVGGRDGACWELASDEAIVLAAIDDVRQCFYAHDRKITLAGFSSGGSLAYQLGLKNAKRFAGILVEHASIPSRDMLGSASRKIPIAATGGKRDTYFPPKVYQADWNALRAAGFPIETQELDVTHDGTSEEWAGFLLPKFGKWVAP